jgi:hypothetical protein
MTACLDRGFSGRIDMLKELLAVACGRFNPG